MKVNIYEMESSLMFTIKTKKYRRYIGVSKSKSRFPKLWDDNVVNNPHKVYTKFRNEWINAKKLRELIDIGIKKKYGRK